MAYRIIVHKPDPLDRASGRLITHTTHDLKRLSLEEAKELVRVMRQGYPPGFIVELQDEGRHIITVEGDDR